LHEEVSVLGDAHGVAKSDNDVSDESRRHNTKWMGDSDGSRISIVQSSGMDTSCSDLLDVQLA
jgi:hypothetical protein